MIHNDYFVVKYLEEHSLQRRTVQWKPLEDSDIPFSQLTDEQLTSLPQAFSYHTFRNIGEDIPKLSNHW